MFKLLIALQAFLNEAKEDTKGATIIEYSLLIGLLTVSVVAAIALVGPWLLLKWQALCTAAGIAGC